MGVCVMNMQKCTIYIRAYKKKTVDLNQSIQIKDVADVAAEPIVKAEVDQIKIFYVPEAEKSGRYIVTIIDVINAIWKVYPNADIQCLGETDMIVDYKAKPIKQNTLWEWIKALSMCITVFAGAGIAIMTYNTDTSLGKTFVIINRLFTGKEVQQPYLLTIPYSIGIATGIILFFNHIGMRKITDDPTPMQVEIEKYEQDVESAEVESITNKRRGEP